MINTLAQLLRDWWRHDRVRVSAREGKLLRLRPPCYLQWGARRAEVIARAPLPAGDGIGVRYRCRVDDGSSAELSVRLDAAGGEPRLCWYSGGTAVLLDAAELQVFSAEAGA